ncbi:P-loop containing nucleoside triphosphate hydrolase protein [Heliocybe sulcata]|uniref:P-loop containing nucleoside triphosphate hydrolase protein n=1 Tax=Heliocybe sulcata TaxID=5364 RepID=A0A5C3N9Y5_9AGAM|nr:P-loop containing nucleoside triphosphate hydrolase protein [Heliocybe sulcata]
MSRPPCRFYESPGGCWRGSACTFRHGDAAPALHRPSSPSPSRSSSPDPSQPASAPSGVCRVFWSSGTCQHGFRCRYRHVSPPGTRRPSVPVNADQDSAAIARVAPFLTEAGLARLAAPGSDAHTSLAAGSGNLTPSEAQSHLRTYLFDNFRFRSAHNVYGLGKILESATATNNTWTQEDGQLLLSVLATGNGLLRLIDVIAWPKVSMQAGQDREVLSFQRGYFPVLRYLSSDFVARSTLSHLVNALYSGLIMENFEHFSRLVKECMEGALSRNTFKDVRQSQGNQIGGSQILTCLCGLLFEVLTRFKNAVPTYKGLRPLVLMLRDWVEAWTRGVSSSPATFDDVVAGWPPIMRDTTIDHLRTKISPLVSIVDREQAKMDRITRRNEGATTSSAMLDCDDAIAAALLNAYEGPGEDRANGPRHDNDFVDIDSIRTIPTHDELSCRVPPFLPANIYGAPHPFPAESSQRLLDTQFRLLREELTAPLRTSAQLVMDDLRASSGTKTRLQEIIVKGGGKYRSYADKLDSIMFNVYTEVKFASLEPDRRGLAVAMSLDAPPGRACSPQSKSRVHFWEGAAGKRLMQGGLIALVWKSGTDIVVHLGVVASSTRDLTESAKQSSTRVTIRVVFFDSNVELRIMQALKHGDVGRQGCKLLVEAPVMFEAIRPFLEALRTEPETLPFAKYLVHHPRGDLAKLHIEPPSYSRLPDFGFKLDCLFDKEAGVENLVMNPRDPHSVEAARDVMKRSSRLDPSQANSVVEALTREVALIQGPPGTGKSYTGVELLRVLVANNVRPILMIAFTNHALDHLLRSVLETDVTQRIVRLGSRSNDEKISKLNIEALEILAGQSRLDREFARHYRALKQVQGELRDLMKDFLQVSIDAEKIVRFIEIRSPSLWESLIDPPEWVSILQKLQAEDTRGYQTVGRRGQTTVVDDSLYAFWCRGGDLDFIASFANFQRRPEPTSTRSELQPLSPPRGGNRFVILQEANASELSRRADSAEDDPALAPEEEWMDISYSEDEDSDPLENTQHSGIQGASSESAPAAGPLQGSDLSDPAGFFASLGLPGIPTISTSNRSLEELEDQHDIWSLSKTEREKLHTAWEDQLRIEMYGNQVADFERLRRRHNEVLEEYNEGKQESRRNLLQNVDIIGCTTTGAARLTALLKSIAPRVLLVEEAGQVLEAHVLGSLVPSIQHVIMIGDPLQLRPTLNNFGLSVDSRQGAQLYRFDMSLMERLSAGGLPMSRIDIQRRMRPSISNLIRYEHTLYPTLEDHDLVRQYPPVRGLARDVFFLSHNHVESGGDDSGKYNTFEVDMIKDLVLYLLRQGCYSNEGDIVVLCAYLGQLARMRDALSDEVAVVIDERDQQLLAEREDEGEGTMEENGVAVEHVKVSKRVRLRTIDNYQGEEAEIVILSLVRNSGGSDEDEEPLTRANIGFLRSENRTNVALSRAKQGLFILGNSRNLASRSKMWRSVLAELESNGAVGQAFPIACQRHPDKVEYISRPGQLPRVAPDGGCMQACDARLPCGHVCPYKCHSDDPRHVSVICSQPCRRLCPRNHPCPKDCSTACGQCMYPIADVELPCGHPVQSVPCDMLDRLSDVYCTVLVEKQLLSCEHAAVMSCSQDPAGHQCRSVCGGAMTCCGRPCKSRCFQCQGRNAPAATQAEEEDTIPAVAIPRTAHVEHPCERTLPCEHRCQQACSENHECTRECKEPCRQVCVHARCKNYCSTPCSPCQEGCTWVCAHYTCPVPCGSVCARLPCDKRCEKILSCAHRCPSVCGEDCSIQICPICATEDEKAKIVDFILQETLGNVDPDQETLDQLLITLPNCGHVFTVETLDGHCDMKAYYDQDEGSGKWLSLKAPSPGFINPPVCPTCRAAITAPRYGRVFKRADLDILEKNVVNRMARSLSAVSEITAGASKPDIERQLREEAQGIQVASVAKGDNRKQRQRKRQGLLDGKRETPIAASALNPQVDEYHGISASDAGPWRKVVQPLLQAYGQAVRIADTRSAHMNAWESAFSCLVQRELDAVLTDPVNAPRNPRDHAMRMARMVVGQPKPQADKRFCVEAFWVTINVRFTLADLAQTWVEALKGRGAYPRQHVQMWALYRQFLLRSCLVDATVALNIAEQSEARRQMTVTCLLIMRAELELSRLHVQMNRDNGILERQREKLLESVVEKRLAATSYKDSVIRAHRAKLGAPAEAGWLRDNFANVAETVVEEWSALELSVRGGSFYQPVSIEDKMSVIKAFQSEFGYGGHYYTCPNGHTYVITEARAMQASRCPECNATIGGNNHTLTSGNQRANDMEELARQAGAQTSPWAWGR